MSFVERVLFLCICVVEMLNFCTWDASCFVFVVLIIENITMSPQQFCLKWNNHTNNMLNVFESLLSTEALVDVTLACDGLSLKAHKLVLSACSPFFQSLFLENPCKHPIVIMKDMNYKDLKAIIDFMYRGEVNVSQDELSAFLKTAETLKVKGLAKVTGKNRGQSDMVQQRISSSAALTTSQQQSTRKECRSESSPLHGKRKRGRPRKRLLSDWNSSDDDVVPSKVKDRELSDIKELSNKASMDAGDTSHHHRQGSNSSTLSQVHHGSSANFSSANHLQLKSSNAHIEEPTSGDDSEVKPSKHLEQTLTTDHVPPMNASASYFSLPSSSGIKVSPIGMSDNQALVPVSASDSSSHLQGPDSPQDIMPSIIFDEPPVSMANSVAGTSQSSRSMMMHMNPSSMPGTSSNFQDQSLHDSQPQVGETTFEKRFFNPKPTKWFRCDLCFYTTTNKLHFDSHYSRHRGKSPLTSESTGSPTPKPTVFVCPVCDYKTWKAARYNRHIRTQHILDDTE